MRQNEQKLSENASWHQVDAPASLSSQKHGRRLVHEAVRSHQWLYVEEQDLSMRQDEAPLIHIYDKSMQKR